MSTLPTNWGDKRLDHADPVNDPNSVWNSPYMRTGTDRATLWRWARDAWSRAAVAIGLRGPPESKRNPRRKAQP